MMGIEYIQALARDAGVRAQHMKLEPKILGAGSSVESIKSIPNLGSYVPKGWTMVDRLFVDSSGFVAPDEPALTFEQFVGEVYQRDEFGENEIGYAVVEAGQFQVYIGVFERTETK